MTSIVAAAASSSTNGCAMMNPSLPSSAVMVPSPVIPPNDRSHKGALVVTVLSAYDLPSSTAQPTAVSLQVCGSTVKTGAPSSKHKDRNSFRFVSNQTLRVEAPLSQLYKTKALLTVEFANSPQLNLSAELVCKTLHIHETTWLILNLEGSSKNSTTGEEVDEDDEDKPTLRLQVRLEGPYRTEIAALVSMANSWFAIMDNAQDSIGGITQKLPSVNVKYLLIPTVPIVTAVVVLSPILVGILVVGLPILLPVLVAVATVLLAGGGIFGLIAASSRSGRAQLGGMFAPMYHTLLSTPSGQTLVYETGPRPTPVSLARAILPQDLLGKLVVSLVIDAIGSSSYLIPVVGEIVDVPWAPIQTIFIMAMYDSISPNLKYVSFFEELLPFTDAIPSATIGWISEFGPQLLPALQQHQQNGSSSSSSSRSSMRTSLITPMPSSTAVGAPNLRA